MFNLPAEEKREKMGARLSCVITDRFMRIKELLKEQIQPKIILTKEAHILTIDFLFLKFNLSSIKQVIFDGSRIVHALVCLSYTL